MQTVNINILKNYVEFLGAKDASGGFMPPDRFNEMVPILVYKIAKKYYGIPEQYQPGMPMPAIAMDVSQAVIDYMANFRVEIPLTVSATGRVKRPADYMHKSSAVATSLEEVIPDENGTTYDCCHSEMIKAVKNGKTIYKKKWKPVTFVTDQERWTWLNSSLRKPTEKFPIAVILGNDEIQIYPEEIKNILLVYIRYPKKPVWGYTVQGGVAVYNPATSVDIELPEVLTDEVAVTILERLGIVIREPGLIDFARYVKNSGK